MNQRGSPVGTNCDVGVSTTGCGVLSSTQGAYANEFNNLGGGAYVMERGKNAINVWYFSRGNYPDSLLSGSPNPCEFGIPEASFPFDYCDQSEFSSKFPRIHFENSMKIRITYGELTYVQVISSLRIW